MANYCDVCGKKIGLFSMGKVDEDETICKDCLKARNKASKKLGKNALASVFSPNKEVGNSEYVIKIDRKNKLFSINRDVFSFDELISFSYNEYPENKHSAAMNFAATSGAMLGASLGSSLGMLSSNKKTKLQVEEKKRLISRRSYLDVDVKGKRGFLSGTIRSAIGGTIGGAIGAAVGKRFIGNIVYCESMSISVYTSNPRKPSIEMNFISTATLTDSEEYALAQVVAGDCLRILREIMERKNPENNNIHINKTETTNQKKGSADEIREYYELWQDGIISKKEFLKKKEEILQDIDDDEDDF